MAKQNLGRELAEGMKFSMILNNTIIQYDMTKSNVYLWCVIRMCALTSDQSWLYRTSVQLARWLEQHKIASYMALFIDTLMQLAIASYIV